LVLELRGNQEKIPKVKKGRGGGAKRGIKEKRFGSYKEREEGKEWGLGIHQRGAAAPLRRRKGGGDSST